MNDILYQIYYHGLLLGLGGASLSLLIGYLIGSLLHGFTKMAKI